MAQRGGGPDRPVWGPRDTALLLTCRAFSERARGQVIGAAKPTPFPLRPPARRCHFVGPVQVLELRRDGDGSYMHSSGVAFGTGFLGAALLAGSLVGNAAANSRARARAMQDAQLTFRYSFDGDVFVTDVGFVFGSVHGIGHWTHDDVDLMQMVAPGEVVVQARSEGGPVTWKLLTPWAELLFAMWAIARHPQNPQLANGSWFPQGWIPWARSQGHDPGLAHPVIGPR